MTDNNLNKYLRIKERVELSQQKIAKAEGALDEMMKQLKKEFGCKTLQEAKEKLKQSKKQKRILGKKFEKAIEKFEEDWPDEAEE
jgi:hypothetical protein